METENKNFQPSTKGNRAERGRIWRNYSRFRNEVLRRTKHLELGFVLKYLYTQEGTVNY